MATTVSIPLLNLRHNGPRGVGAAGSAAPMKALRRFQDAPPDLVQQEAAKLQAEKKKLFESLRSGACTRPRACPPAPRRTEIRR